MRSTVRGVFEVSEAIQAMLPCRLGLWNAMTASLQRGKTLPTSILQMTLNNLMVRFQLRWSFWYEVYSFITVVPRSTLARSGSI